MSREAGVFGFLQGASRRKRVRLRHDPQSLVELPSFGTLGLAVDGGLRLLGFRVLGLSLLGANPGVCLIRNLGEEEQVVAAEGLGGLPVRPVSVQAAEGDVVAGARLGVVFPDGGLDGPHADLFGRVVLGSHGMCRKKQVNPTCRASPPTWKTAGFKPLETIPSVLPWLAALNKRGQGTQ